MFQVLSVLDHYINSVNFLVSVDFLLKGVLRTNVDPELYQSVSPENRGLWCLNPTFLTEKNLLQYVNNYL